MKHFIIKLLLASLLAQATLISKSAAAEKYLKDYLRDIPAKECKENTSYKFDNHGTLYVLDDEKEQVRVYDLQDKLLRTIDWSVQEKGTSGKGSYQLSVDNRGDCAVWTVFGTSFVYDDEGKYTGEFSFKSWEHKLYSHLLFHDGILYSEWNGTIIFQMDPKATLKQTTFIDDFLIEYVRVSEDGNVPTPTPDVMIKGKRAKGFPMKIRISNKKSGASQFLDPMGDNVALWGISGVDDEGNVYLRFDFQEEVTTKDGETDYSHHFKTMKLDKNLKFVLWNDGGYVPNRDTLNYFEIDESNPSKFIVYYCALNRN